MTLRPARRNILGLPMARRLVSNAIRADWLKSFSRYVKIKRKRRQITQKALADCVSVSVHTIRKIESGHFVPSRELATDIGDVFEEPHTALAAAGYIPFMGWRP